MPDITSYAAALRCIGQALQRQGIIVFELQVYDYDFHLHCVDPNPPYTIHLSYSLKDLEALERQGQAKRGRPSTGVRFNSLPEILRTLGKYVDEKGGSVWRICTADQSVRDPTIELEYKTRDRHLQAETLPLSLISEMSMRMYKRRTESPKLFGSG
ncbi:MAG TPA: hypothetical protein VFU31_24315 [Candidatus Binatia bacterium]|nr:hypothetical protein [Candidatus Binatia bacterium]